ncbi:MAG TPA: TonB-dependent receptor [Caulobacteraceae bacterium]|nr:TonB-dependent receptor [Caulobacteraceae bacterium]
MLRKSRLSRSAAQAALLGGLALAGPAWAADASSPPRSGQATEVETLVITAERRVENLQTAAVSATVLDQRTLAAKGVVNLTSLQFAAPGIQISDYSSANTFNIRGIGQSQVDIDLPSGVVIYRDGVPTLTGYFQNAPYYDMAGVEVLRGPQGTFGGKSASAGAVFIRTRDPELGHYGGEAMGGFGNRGYWEGTGVVNMPISDTLAIRWAVHGELRNSLFDSITSNPIPGGLAVTGEAGGPFKGDDDRRLISTRVGILWEPNSRFRSVLKADYDYLHFGSHVTTGFNPATGLEEDLRNPIANGPNVYTDKGVRMSLNMSYELGGGYKLSSLSGFSTVNTRADWDVNGSNPYAAYFRTGGDFTNYSQELNLTSPADQRLSWVAGLFLQRYLNHIPSWPDPGFSETVNNNIFGQLFGLPPGFIPPDAPVEASPWDKKEWNYAAFGQIDYHFTDALDLQLGGRVGHYEFTQFSNFVLYPSLFNIPLEGSPGHPEPNGHTQKYSENSFDWKVDLNYKLTPDHFLYGLISRGHTPGSINLGPANATADHLSYKPMTVINYEGGWKGSFFDGHLRTQLAAYYQTFKNYQAFFGEPAPAGTPPELASIDALFQARNALTTSKIYGVEFGAQGSFGDLALDAGLALFKSRLGLFGQVNNPFCSLYMGNPVVAGSVQACAGPVDKSSRYYGVYGTSAQIVLDGAETPFSPTFTGNFGAAYTFHFDPGGRELNVTPRVDVAYRTDSYANLFHNPSTLLEGGFVVNASINFTRGPWWASLWATNLLDRTYAGAKQNVAGDPGLGDTHDAIGTQEGAWFAAPHVTGIVYMAPPRLFGLRIGRSF